jgi:hypothetical protein
MRQRAHRPRAPVRRLPRATAGARRRHQAQAPAPDVLTRNRALRYGLAGIALFRVAAMPSVVAGAIVYESTTPTKEEQWERITGQPRPRGVRG